jgi:hypothetical protein
VLTREEVPVMLEQMSGVTWLLAGFCMAPVSA